MKEAEVISIYLDSRNDIQKVPYGFWSRKHNIKVIVKYIVEEELQIPVENVPKILTYKKCLKMKLRQPLKYFGHSPYKMLNYVYNNKFSPLDFNIVPKETYASIRAVKAMAKKRIERELNFSKDDIRNKMTREVMKSSGLYKVSRMLTDYEYSLLGLLNFVYPGEFKKSELIFYKDR